MEKQKSGTPGFAREPAVLIVKTRFRSDAGAPGCWIGGLPSLPDNVEWPWRMDGDRALHPLHFIAQINLAHLPGGAARLGLPEQGFCSFFANYVHDPEGQSAVIHAEADVTDLKERTVPEFPDGFEKHGTLRHWLKNPVFSFDRWPVTFHAYEALDRDVTPVTDAFNGAVLAEQRALQAVAAEQKNPRRALMERLKGADRGAPRRTVARHTLMGPDNRNARSRPAQSGFVRLLSLAHDEDIRFDYSCEELVFLIHRDDLTNRRFDGAFARSAQ